MLGIDWGSVPTVIMIVGLALGAGAHLYNRFHRDDTDHAADE